MDKASNYDTVKELILKAYELVPEAYRQKFRNCEKISNQTVVEFARAKEQLFDRWCASEKINRNHEKLRQIILVEEFKRCVHADIRTFINKQKGETLADAARVADDFYLSHKISYVNQTKQSFPIKQNFVPGGKPYSAPYKTFDAPNSPQNSHPGRSVSKSEQQQQLKNKVFNRVI